MIDKKSESWHSSRIGQEVNLVRWGHFGTPVLLFPTAGGDAEEIERFKMIHVLDPLLEAGRIKVYSVDSTAGRALISGEYGSEYCSRLLNRFDEMIYKELVPAIQADCNSDSLEIITAGA